MSLLKLIITTFFFIFSYLSLNALTFKNGKEVTLENGIDSHENKIDLEKRIKRVFGNDYYSDPIANIKINKDWPFAKSNKALDNFNKIKIRDVPSNQLEIAKKCVDTYTINFDINGSDNCNGFFPLYFHTSRDISLHQEVLLKVAMTDSVKGDVYPNDFSNARYDSVAFISTNATFYSYYYDYFNYSDEEREIIKNYFLTKLKTLDMETVGEYNQRTLCDPYKQKNIGNKILDKPADNNTCGSNRWKMSVGQLFAAIRFQDQELLDLAVYNIRFMLEVFDEEGIFVTWAIRGALAWDYSKDVAPMISIIAEGLHALNYDFFEYKNRHGMTVKQIMDKQFEIVDNISLLEKYAKRQWATKGTDYKTWTKLSNEDRLIKWPKSHIIYKSPRYIERYNKKLADLASCESLPTDKNISAIGSFITVDIREVYLSNKSPTLCVNELSNIKTEKINVKTDDVDLKKLPEALKNIGIGLDTSDKYYLKSSNDFTIGNFTLVEKKLPKVDGKSTKYIFSFDEVKHRDSGILIKGEIIYYVKEKRINVNYILKDFFNLNPTSFLDWLRLLKECGKLEDSDTYEIEVPIRNGWEELEKVFSCYANNVEDESLKNLFQGLILIGGILEPEKFN